MEEATTAKRPASFWFFAIGTAALFIASSVILVSSLSSGELLARKALAKGQRIIVTLQSGEIEGSVFKPPVEKPVVIEPKLPNTLTEAQPPKPIDPDSQKPDVSVPMQPVDPAQATGAAPVVPEAILNTLPEPAPFYEGAKNVPLAMPQYSRGTNSLALAPFKPLTETIGEFMLPRIALEDKETPWQHYGKAVVASKRPMVAIIITGLGQSRKLTDSALSLAPLFTLSFSPYAKDSPLWVLNARNRGFESWLDLPVEPLDFPASDPGPKAILDDKSPDDNMNNLRWSLSRFSGYAGVTIPASEQLTPNDALAGTVLQEISSRGVQTTYLETVQNGAFTKTARSGKKLIVPANMNLGEKLSEREILSRLQALVQLAKKDGHAVGMISAYPVSLETLRGWTQTLKDSGVDLVPLTAIAQKIQ